MKLIFTLFFTFFLTKTFAITEVHQGVEEANESKQPTLHLPLYHVHGKDAHSPKKQDPMAATQLSFSDIIAQDEARLAYLNSKLTKKNSTSPRPRSSINEESTNAPLYPGVPLGVINYYTKIGLGTPSTDYLVLVDTGSALSWVQCQPCEGYCHQQEGSIFDPSASTTYQRLSCDTSQCKKLQIVGCSSNVCLYKVLYGDQSTTEGYLSQDSLTFGPDSFPGFVFGCGQYNRGRFGRLDGIFGLDRNDLSVLHQLTADKGKKVIFSYCLPSITGGGGFLSIGSSNSVNYHFTNMLTISEYPDFYSLKLSSISVSGNPLDVVASAYTSNPMVIDSGTSLSYLPTPVYSALRDELVKTISPTYQILEENSFTCFRGSVDEIASVLPSIELIFDGGAGLNLSPKNVLLKNDERTTCLSFTSTSGNNDIAIIGNQQQQTFDIVYVVDGSRIGFAAGGCS